MLLWGRASHLGYHCYATHCPSYCFLDEQWREGRGVLHRLLQYYLQTEDALTYPRSPILLHKCTQNYLGRNGQWERLDEIEAPDGFNLAVQPLRWGEDLNWSVVDCRLVNISTLSTLLTHLSRRVDRRYIHAGKNGRLLVRKDAATDVLLYLQQKSTSMHSFEYVKMLQRCMEVNDLVAGRQVHDHIIRNDVQPNVFVVNTLMNMYIRFGNIGEARQVFDRCSNKSNFTWNSIIAGYARHGRAKEAFTLFCQMQEEGLNPDRNSYLSILNACSSSADLEWGKEVHAVAMKAGLLSDVRVGNCIVNMYVKCGSVRDAQHVFDKMVIRNVVSWTMMIKGYAESGHSEDAIETFLQMQCEGVEPNKITYLSILRACSSPAALKQGRLLHAHIIDAGIQSDLLVGTALVNMYLKCGSNKEACQVFEKLANRDVILWNTMIGGLAESGHWEEAFEVFDQMQREGIVANRITYTSILNGCTSPVALERGKEVYNHALVAGFLSDVRVANALITMYAKCGSIKDARLVFDKMVRRDVVSWTAMIGGYVECGLGEEAFRTFQQMVESGVEPNNVTYMYIMNACSSTGALDRGKQVHAQVVKAELIPDVLIGNALVNMYSKCGDIESAREVFDKMVKRDVISWNAMIGGYAGNNLGEEAFKLFNRMQQEGPTPDKITYLSILNACASPASLNRVKEVHTQILAAGLISDVSVGNALINIYAKCGSIKDAHDFFEVMTERNIITWNAMIGGFAYHGRGHDALLIFEQMKKVGVSPDAITLVNVLSACSHAGLVEEGRLYFSSLSEDYGIVPTNEHYGCMVDLLSRAGHLDEAEHLIQNMPLKANASVWGALLGACKMHGNVTIAERAADSSLKINPHNAAVYVVLSHVYGAAGMWDSVAKVRKMMEDRGVKKEPGRCWIEIEGKVHCFAAEDTSHPQAKEIYAELENLTQKMKMIGYMPDTRFVMHDVDEQEKEQAVCHHSEKLAIAYGLLRTPPGTPIHIFKNLRVCADCHTATKFISKIVGREIVARDASRFHHFNDGVCSCGEYW